MSLSQISYQLFLSAFLAYLEGQTEPKILRLVRLNVHTGSCTFLPDPHDDCKTHKTLLYIMGFAFPSLALIVSDVAIYLKVG